MTHTTGDGSVEQQISRQVERLELKIDRLSEQLAAVAVSVGELRGAAGAQDVRLTALEEGQRSLSPRVSALERGAARIAGLITLFATLGAATFSWLLGKLHL